MSGNSKGYRESLVLRNLKKVEQAAVQAYRKQLENPVVLVLDPNDPIALAIVDDAGRREEVDAWG